LRQIAAIGKTLGHEWASTCAQRFEPRAGQAHQRKLEEFSNGHERAGIRVVAAGHIVKSSVRLEVAERPAHRPCQTCKGTHLIRAIFENLLFGPGAFLPPKMLPVGEIWVGFGLYT